MQTQQSIANTVPFPSASSTRSASFDNLPSFGTIASVSIVVNATAFPMQISFLFLTSAFPCATLGSPARKEAPSSSPGSLKLVSEVQHDRSHRHLHSSGGQDQRVSQASQ